MTRALVTVVETAGFIASAGGARVIYFLMNMDTPVIALVVYAKNRTAQLTKAQEKELAAIASGIKKAKKEHT